MKYGSWISSLNTPICEIALRNKKEIIGKYEYLQLK